MKRTLNFLLVLVAIVLLSSCSGMFVGKEGGLEEAPGFLMGLWHGFTMFFRFIISLFSDDIFIYYQPNNGGWYNFGYMLGASMFFGGSGSKACGGRRRKE